MNKLYGSWRPESTESFRWTSGLNSKWLGCNLQTLPRSFRFIVESIEQYILVQLDLSQAEARVVAELANCRKLIELFNDPTRNVHMENAMKIFGHYPEKDSPEYVLAKSVIHASNYREGPVMFMRQTGLPVKECRRLLEEYHKEYPEIRMWHERVKATIRSTGILTTPWGHERRFYDAMSCLRITGNITDQQWKDAIAFVPQATIPWITTQAMIKISHEHPDVWLLHHGHDSFLAAVLIEKLASLMPKFIEYMTVKIPIGRGLVIPVNATVGYNWGDMIKWTGHALSRVEWLELVEEKLAKKSRKVELLEGIYGPLMKSLAIE